jgi:hypothetical protein
MILKRTLTKKSVIGFGKYKKETVGKLLEMRLKRALVSMYYKMSSIDFTEDILMELGIVDEWKIDKPSIDNEKYILFIQQNNMLFERTSDSPNALKKERKYTKGYNQSINQGRK